MASDMMFLCAFLLCSGLQFTTGCTGQLPHISCSPGESVLLSCRDINSQQTEVQWWICDPETHALEYSVFPLDTVKGQRYKDRFQMHRNHSLSITRLTVDDAGTYCCKTKDKKSTSPVHLFVEGCFMSGNEGSVISRYLGESVFLSCLIECTFRRKPDSEFRWKLPNSREINQNMSPDELHRLYQGRFHMFDVSSGNLSLQISNLTEKDEGLYSCWSNKQHKSFTITVAGCVLSQHHITKSSSAGETVILPCSCEDPKTRPERFKWKRAAVNETLVSDAEEINGRFQMIRDSPHNLFLQISNLTETDGGLYVCSVNTRQSRVTLTLTHSAVIKSDNYQYYLIFLLCLMLLLVAGCVCWRFTRARKQRRGSQLIQSPEDEDDTYTSVVYSSS